MDALASPATKENRATQALEFLTKHFVVLSAVGVVTVSLCAAIFVYAYVAMFDWRLIWVVEYSDIFKASLAALGLFYFSMFVFQALVLLVVAKPDAATVQKYTTRGLPVLVVLVALFALFVWLTNGLWFLALAVGGWVIMIAVTGSRITLLLMEIPNVRAPIVAETFLAILGAMFTLGSSFAIYTQEMRGFNYDVTLKNEKLEDVGLVMVTSHHTILYANEKSIVVPTAEVLKLQARSTQPPKIGCAAAEAC